MVRARHFGKKWVLRACGRALFADIAAWYNTEVSKFVFPGPAQRWERLHQKFGRQVAGDSMRLFRAGPGLKAASLRPSDPHFRDEFLFPCCLLYLKMLAESRGFGNAEGALATVWDRSSAWLEGVLPEGKMGQLLKGMPAMQLPDFSFRLMEIFASDFFPHTEFLSELEKLGPEDWCMQMSRKLYARLGNAARDMLGVELITTVFFVKFLQVLHNY